MLLFQGNARRDPDLARKVLLSDSFEIGSVGGRHYARLHYVRNARKENWSQQSRRCCFMDIIVQHSAVNRFRLLSVPTDREQQDDQIRQRFVQHLRACGMELRSGLDHICLPQWIGMDCKMVFITQTVAAVGSYGTQHLFGAPNVSACHTLQPEAADLLGLLHANSEVLGRRPRLNLSRSASVPCCRKSLVRDWKLFAYENYGPKE